MMMSAHRELRTPFCFYYISMLHWYTVTKRSVRFKSDHDMWCWATTGSQQEPRGFGKQEIGRFLSNWPESESSARYLYAQYTLLLLQVGSTLFSCKICKKSFIHIINTINKILGQIFTISYFFKGALIQLLLNTLMPEVLRNTWATGHLASVTFFNWANLASSALVSNV